MSRYSPESDVLVTVGSGVPGRAAVPALRAGGTGRLAAGRAGGLAGTLILFAPFVGLAAAVLGPAAAGLAAAFGFAVARDLAVAAVRDVVTVRDVVAFRADADRAVAGLVAAFGLAAVRGFAVARGLAAALGLAAVRGLAIVRAFAFAFGFAAFFGVAAFGAAAGFADDIVLAAAVSDLEAMVMALVEAFIACRAADIVLADEVALVAAAVILVAAEVTFAAAEDTVLAAATVVGAVLAAAGLALTRPLGLVATLGLLPACLIAPVRLARARAVFEPRRVALRAVDCRGIDLPP